MISVTGHYTKFASGVLSLACIFSGSFTPDHHAPHINVELHVLRCIQWPWFQTLSVDAPDFGTLANMCLPVTTFSRKKCAGCGRTA